MSSSQIDRLKIAEDYVRQKLNTVLEDMVTCIVADMPADPARFMYDWLLKKSGKSENCGSIQENQQLKEHFFIHVLVKHNRC